MTEVILCLFGHCSSPGKAHFVMFSGSPECRGNRPGNEVYWHSLPSISTTGVVAVASISTSLAYCEVTWTGVANSYNHEGYTNTNVVKFDFLECCKQVRPKAAQDAQKAWNVESERFQQAVEQQTSISASYVPGGPVTGTVTQSDAESRQYDVDYADRRWTVTADCDCIQDGFISTDAGCNPQTLVDGVVDTAGGIAGGVVEVFTNPLGAAASFLGSRKLMQGNDCGNAGRRRDSCSVKVQCTYKAVTASSCEDSNNMGNNGFDNGFNQNNNGFNGGGSNGGGFNGGGFNGGGFNGGGSNGGGFNGGGFNGGGFNGGGFNGGGFNNAGNGNPDFATPYGACACTEQCGPKQATPGFCYNGGQGSCRVGSACQGKNLRPYQGWTGTSYYLCC